MPFENATNAARARNMAELLGHLQTSARSNNAQPAEVAEILRPAIDAMAALGLELRIPSAEASSTRALTIRALDKSRATRALAALEAEDLTEARRLLRLAIRGSGGAA